MIEENFEDEEDVISKSQIKRELHALKDLGKELVKLTLAQLEKMPVSEELRSNVIEAKKYKQKALKRQLQRIGVLMREEDADAIQKAMVKLHKPERQQIKALHKIEKWRDDLIAGESGVVEELTEECSEIDHQYINQMIRNAKKEKTQNKPPKSSRALFQYLQSLHENKL
ncbi:MAG: ribosome biogenesis factor YjgA [Gammaproteobacteria bacterium]